MSEILSKINRSLQHKIAEKIKQKGAISFAEFMNMALYEPGLGYYSAGLKKLGTEGDFVTSPELGQLFARCHASFFAPLLSQLSQPLLLELGAGSGKFCCDVLTALDAMDVLPDQYAILEVSADLKQLQQQKVAALPSRLQQRVVWLEQPPEQSFEGIIFANEVLDALPVEVFQYTTDGFQQLMLSDQDGQLTEVWQPFKPLLEQQLTAMALDLKPGYRSEFLPQLSAWMASVVKPLRKGVVLMVDYGYSRTAYYHPQRDGGTLVCHRRHQANFNPYQDVGLQDITAFVDFTAVAEAMSASGLTVEAFTTQADFLLAMNIEQWLDPAAEYADYFRLVTEMKQLVLPDEMGEKFKCMVASKALDIELGLPEANRLHEL